MGFNTVVKKTSLDIMQVVKRPPQVYPIAAATNLFTIVGGPVYIHGLFFYADDNVDLANTGTTMVVQICGVAADSPTTAVRTLIGRVCVWPLNNTAPVPDLAMNIMPTVGGVRSALASPGSSGGNNITVAVATASTVGTCSWYVLYFRMDPDAEIIVAV